MTESTACDEDDKDWINKNSVYIRVEGPLWQRDYVPAAQPTLPFSQVEACVPTPTLADGSESSLFHPVRAG